MLNQNLAGLQNALVGFVRKAYRMETEMLLSLLLVIVTRRNQLINNSIFLTNIKG